MNKVKFKPKEFNLKILPRLLDHIQSLDNEEYELSVSKVRKARSLDQNSYFHALVGELSDVTNKGFEEVKKELNIEYGTLAKDENGKCIGFMLPSTANPESVYKYTKWFDTRTDANGVEFDCYLVFKETHKLNSKEMAKLIEGTIQECEEYGIPTLSPSEVALLEGKQ